MQQNYCGSCLCGEVRFEFTSPSLWCAHCHCTMCQRSHGAPLVTWVGVPESALQFGEASPVKWYQSSEQAQRGFCTNCGSSLFFRSSQWPGEMHIARSNISGEIDREPGGHVYWESHVPWFGFEDDLVRRS